MFQQLGKEERKILGHIRDALYVAFTTNPFVVYDLFIARHLNANESVDVNLADLLKLSTLCGGCLTVDLHVHL